MIDVALKNVFRQKTRSALTILGIAMGIGLILTLGSIGEGLSANIQASFGDMAAVVEVTGPRDEQGITEDQISQIESIIGVSKVIPIGEYSIRRTGRGMPAGMMGRMFSGSSPSLQFTALDPQDFQYLVPQDIIADYGRRLEEYDDHEHVALLGYSAAQSQVLNLADEIEYERDINGSTETYYFEVIGILEYTGDQSIDGAVYVPLSTMQEILEDERIVRLKVNIDSIESVEQITQDIRDISDDLRAMSPLAFVRSLEETLGTITMAVYGIGAVSILVGGIGIMNTMIMSVMERRREIGIMKAIGATTSDILLQVLEESAILSLIGGLSGFALGYGAIQFVTEYTGFEAIMSAELIGMGFAFSLVLGMGAGLYPAWSASRLDPIEVLRYE